MVDFDKLTKRKKGEETDVAAPISSGTTVAVTPTEIDYSALQQDGAATAIQVTPQDMAIPFLRVLQSNSPQVDRDSPKYVKGAEAGQFINTVTGRYWDGRDAGILVAVVAYQRSYTEWKPRAADGKAAGGGGFVKDWGSDDSLYKAATPDPVKKSKMMTDHGTEVVQAAMYYVYVVDPETGLWDRMVFNLAGTQLKKARRWNSLIKAEQLINPETRQPFSPPPFFRLYRLTTVPEQNEQGSWKGVKIEPDRTIFDVPNGSLLYHEALAFKTGIDAGEVKVAPPDQPEFGDADPSRGDAKDEDTPF